VSAAGPPSSSADTARAWGIQPAFPAARQRANLVPDAHLAALATEHGLLLVSTNPDLAPFPELRFENPLAGPPES
jgi:predicted nucleic acid-binding protein